MSSLFNADAGFQKRLWCGLFLLVGLFSFSRQSLAGLKYPAELCIGYENYGGISNSFSPVLPVDSQLSEPDAVINTEQISMCGGIKLFLPQ